MSAFFLHNFNQVISFYLTKIYNSSLYLEKRFMSPFDLLFLFELFLLMEAFPKLLLNVSVTVFIICNELSPPAAKIFSPVGSQYLTKCGGFACPSL